jgi:acyl-coenzyme A thioesterase PaaI-like protein
MRPPTHELLDAELCGVPGESSPGHAEVEFIATERMRTDASGLVHGGFVFGLADHAAMLAVGAPTVVLAAAELKFLAPVVVGDRVRATATTSESTGKKHLVDVVVRRDDIVVMEARMTCVVPTRHVLDGGRDARR